jgi:hypothetical protein
MSITEVRDLTAKYIRKISEPFIGKFKINNVTITSYRLTLDAAMNQLVANGYIESYEIGKIMQDEDNPDSLIVEVSIKPFYPCNYINITLFM